MPRALSQHVHIERAWHSWDVHLTLSQDIKLDLYSPQNFTVAMNDLAHHHTSEAPTLAAQSDCVRSCHYSTSLEASTGMMRAAAFYEGFSRTSLQHMTSTALVHALPVLQHSPVLTSALPSSFAAR